MMAARLEHEEIVDSQGPASDGEQSGGHDLSDATDAQDTGASEVVDPAVAVKTFLPRMKRSEGGKKHDGDSSVKAIDAELLWEHKQGFVDGDEKRLTHMGSLLRLRKMRTSLRHRWVMISAAISAILLPILVVLTYLVLGLKSSNGTGMMPTTDFLGALIVTGIIVICLFWLASPVSDGAVDAHSDI